MAHHGRRIVAPKVRGADQLVQVGRMRRPLRHGIESVLVTDEGLLEVLGEPARRGAAAELILKGPHAAANPVSVRNLERLGLTTFNVPTDLSLAQLAALRAATTMPLDIYIEVPDDVGEFIRHYEIAEIVRVTAPVYLKFGLRNAPNIYPSGTHLEATAVSLTRERLRRRSSDSICCIVSIRTRSCRHYRSRLSPAPNGRGKALRYADRRLRRPRDLGS